MNPESFWYAIDDDLESRYYCKRHGYPLEPDYFESLAVCAAENFYRHHDGNEWKWPLTFVLFESDSGSELGRCEVYLDYDPLFSASVIEPTES